MEEKKCTLTKEGAIIDLKTALNSEMKALDLYNELSGILKDEADINMVNTIISDEKRHIQIVNNLIEVVEKYYTEQ